MRRRQVISHAGFRPRCDRQGEINWPLSHQPDSRRSIAPTKENESCNIRSVYLTRKLCDVFAVQRFHESSLSQRAFAKEIYRLLPFAFARDVGVVAAAKGEDGNQVSLIAIVVTQPTPGLIIRSRKLCQGRGPKLGVLREEAD